MKRTVALAVLAAAACTGTAFAHHSFAMFDNTKLVVVRGAVLSFANMNPHAWISVVGSADGKSASERWDVEATAPGALARIGIGPGALKPGDKVTVGLRPLRDGRLGGSMVFVITADGEVHGAQPAALGLDAATLKP